MPVHLPVGYAREPIADELRRSHRQARIRYMQGRTESMGGPWPAARTAAVPGWRYQMGVEAYRRGEEEQSYLGTNWERDEYQYGPPAHYAHPIDDEEWEWDTGHHWYPSRIHGEGPISSLFHDRRHEGKRTQPAFGQMYLGEGEKPHRPPPVEYDPEAREEEW